MSLPASIIVNVRTDIPPVIDTSTGQNTALFLGSNPNIPIEERVRAFYDANSVGVDCGPESEEYRAAVGYFGQNPNPPILYIGVRGGSETESTPPEGAGEGTETPLPEDETTPEATADEGGEDVITALAACLAKYQFYGVVVSHEFSDADALKAALWAETQIMLTGRASSDPLILDPASATDDFASKLKLQTNRAFCFAREEDKEDYPELATISRTIAVDLRLPSSAITIGVQPLATIEPSGFTLHQFNAATSKNANIYQVIGPNPVVFPGVMANGLFIEDQFGLDFLQSYITMLAINGIERARRVPQTDQGMNYLVGYLDTGLVQIVASGFLAPGYWDAATIRGVVENGELLAKGYKIIASPISTLTPDQRAAGFGSNIAIALKGSGAIHSLNIFMPFNP
jgi:hypothetical protein